MPARSHLRTTMTPPPLHRERGVIMVIALITLVILMIGTIATIRSMNSSLTNIDNFGFKRDMANQADRAMRKALDTLTALGAPDANNPSINYSAVMLSSTPEGIPQVLLDTSDPGAVGGYGSAANVIDLTTAQSGESSTNIPQLKLYYVIDRMCQAAVPVSPTNCQTASTDTQGVKGPKDVKRPPKPLFRVTVRVDGPRGSQSFYQATFSN